MQNFCSLKTQNHLTGILLYLKSMHRSNLVKILWKFEKQVIAVYESIKFYFKNPLGN